MASRSDHGYSMRLWISATVFALFSSARADDAIKIEPVERWSNVFAESETRWTYHISAERPLPDRATWRLTIIQRIAANGEFDLRDDAKNVTDRTITLRWPKVKAGLVQAAQLTVSVGEVKHERTAWVFPRDPFTDQSVWLKSLKLKVFDPQGATVELFGDNEIPHERVKSREALDDVTDGIVIIGEGCSLKKHHGLMDDLRALAARGVPVLCLASVDGGFMFPGEKPQPLGLHLRRSDVIRELDKRLDATWWPQGSSQLSGVRVGSMSDEVTAEVCDDEKSWPWCEWQFENESKKPTRVIWCGFGLITFWDDGPTPRFLLAKILERLSEAIR